MYAGLDGYLTYVNENGYHLYVRSEPDKNSYIDQSVAPQLFPSGRVISEQLLGKRGELVIEHNGREYRLRLTQSGKLILTA